MAVVFPVRSTVLGRPDWVFKLFLSGNDAVGPGLHAFLELWPPGSSVPDRWVSAVWPGPGSPWRSSLASAGGRWVSFAGARGGLADVLRAALSAAGSDVLGLAVSAAALVPDAAAHVLVVEVVES